MSFENLKIGFIFVLYNTPNSEIERLKKEIKELKFKNYQVYFIDNTINNRGFAAGVNCGLKMALKDDVDIFIIANPDISFEYLKNKNFLEGLNYFDILGLSFFQNGEVFYGGSVDKFRLSGGLNKKKPKKRFSEVDFISGSLMILKRKVIEENGFFDEDYFMYYEDVDYCYRAKINGFKVGIDSKLFYNHFEISKKNPKKDYFLLKNRWRFFLKFSNFRQKIYEFFRLPKTFFEIIPILFKISLANNFLINFFSLNFSSFLNKIFHFLLFIFLIRNLNPNEYGIYSLVWAYIGFFNPFTDLGTTNYGLIYLPKKTQFLNKLISLRFFIATLIFIISNVSSLYFFKNQREIIFFIFLSSFSILSAAWSGSYLIINAIKEKVINSSLISLVFNIWFCFLIFIFFLFFKSLNSIFYAVFASFFGYLIFNYLLVKKEIKFKNLEVDISFYKEVILKSLIFVLIGFFANLRYKIDVFLLNFFKGTKEVGLYSSSYKFLEAAILIAGSYNIISMPKFSLLSQDLNLLKRKIKKDALFLTLISFFVIIFFILFADIILPFLFTQKYFSGIKIAKILILALPFIFLNSIFYNFFYSQKKEKIVLNLLISQALFSLIVNFFLVKNHSFWAPAFTTVISESLVTIIAYRNLIKLLKK